MFQDKKKLYQAYHAMLSTALTWALVLVVNQYFVLKVPILITGIYSIVFGILIYLFNLNKNNFISYLGLGSVLPLLALIFWITKTNPVSWLGDIIHWCMIYDGTEELYVASYSYLILLTVALLATILFFLLTKNQLAKYILAAVLTVGLIILSISKINVNKAVVGIVLFFILTILVEVSGIIYNIKLGKPEKKEGILYLAPICLLLAVLAIILPSKQEPIEWKVFKNIYKNVKEQLEIWNTELSYYLGNNNSEFFVNMTGYSEESGKLKKDKELVKDNKIALKLSGMEKGKAVYLTGSINDIYTGNSWVKSREDYLKGEEEYLLDYGELFFALSRQDREVMEDNKLLERRVVRIEYNNIKTKTFFYPLKMSGYQIFSRKKKILSETPQMNFKKASGKGTSYQVVFYEMNLESEEFRQILRDSDTFSYESHLNLAIDNDTLKFVNSIIKFYDIESVINKSDFYEVLRKRAEMIENTYTNLPDTLPDRVYELAKSITADYDNKYDKLKALEEYLITNYTYTYDVDKIPEDADFTDYFLFESKKGYCTYYATAMAVLGRCIGVPTRYVEGYLAKLKVSDEARKFLIDNSQAHAWAEAYIEGVGWIPFEATTPFYGERYSTWSKPVKKNSESNSGSYIPPMEYITPPQFHQETVEEVVIMEDSKGDKILEGFIIFFASIIILLLILILYYNILKYRYKKNFERSDNNKKMYLLFLRILRMLKREGFSLGEQETILMLAERMKDRCHVGEITFMDIADIFMRYRYAEENMTPTDLEKVNTYYQGLRDKEREELSRLKLWKEDLLFLARKSNY